MASFVAGSTGPSARARSRRRHSRNGWSRRGSRSPAPGSRHSCVGGRARWRPGSRRRRARRRARWVAPFFLSSASRPGDQRVGDLGVEARFDDQDARALDAVDGRPRRGILGTCAHVSGPIAVIDSRSELDGRARLLADDLEAVAFEADDGPLACWTAGSCRLHAEIEQDLRADAIVAQLARPPGRSARRRGGAARPARRCSGSRISTITPRPSSAIMRIDGFDLAAAAALRSAEHVGEHVDAHACAPATGPGAAGSPFTSATCSASVTLLT